ncbi:MAG: hypothetical protein E6F98_11480 [Actinobacteria bacterium]|nr:MAG: hypothetical protein E6F98_11480 [Actinomycetota bacterium]
MSLTTGFDIGFAVAVGVAAVALSGAALRFLQRRALVLLGLLVLGGAVAGWAAFALRHTHPRELAIAAGGLTACALAAGASLVVAWSLARAADTEAHIAAAQARLLELVEQEAADRAAELERTLARARADSVSLLAEEERRIAEGRRTAFTDRERELVASLTEALTATQSQVSQRLADWKRDLDRAADATKERLAEIAVRQRQLLGDVSARIEADAERLAADNDAQRESVVRLRSELEKALEEMLANARTEVEGEATERRRALHELGDRLRRRERELREAIEREEVEAAQRIRAGFEDVQRRHIEQMARTVERATMTYADEATQQFAGLVKSSREDAARRLSRELDRAVETFAREAEVVLAERLAHVGDAGAQRLERRLAEAATSLERQRDEWMSALDVRIGELEHDVRRRLDELSADAEAERAVLEARLQELLRRADSTAAVRAP